jgi:uncharacterized membrane protein
MWFYTALAAAFLSGIIVILTKHTLKKTDPILLFWIITVISTPFVIVYAYKDGVPEFTSLFLVGAIGSAIFYTLGKIIFYRIIRDTNLSDVYPLVSIGPVATLIFSLLIFSNKPGLLQIIGSGITILGVYILNISSLREGFLQPFRVLVKNPLSIWMIASVLIGSIVPIFDKVAINNTLPINSTFTLLIENLFIIVILFPWVFSRRKTAFAEITFNVKPLFALGFLIALNNIVAMMSLSDGNPGMVTSIMRIQIFFVLLFSYIIYKDKPRSETILGSIVMILGLVLMKLGS